MPPTATFTSHFDGDFYGNGEQHACSADGIFTITLTPTETLVCRRSASPTASGNGDEYAVADGDSPATGRR